MKVAKTVCTSLAVLAVLLIAKPISAQLEIQDSMSEATLAPVQGISTSIGMTTADSLMEKIQGYSERGSLRSETNIRWQVGENLMATLPREWEIGFQAHQGNFQIVEFVPKGQTVDNWQSLFTIQTVFGGLSKSPRQVFEKSASLMRRFCPNLDVSLVLTGEENGYPFALWVQNCPNNPQVNQAEITLFKVIQGNDNFYFVHRAWRVPTLSPGQAIPIDPTELEEWGRYMRLIGVCDTRIPERNCPSLD
jgi:hypothetical protein